jgi:DNA-binding NarL/FixJ family response regulator
VADALRDLLTSEFEMAGLVKDGLALVNAAKELNPDVIVADISMPGLDGLSALTLLKKENPNVKVVLLTMYQDPALARLALDTGALGYVLKYFASDDLCPAVYAALKGNVYVSPVMAADVLKLRTGSA